MVSGRVVLTLRAARVARAESPGRGGVADSAARPGDSVRLGEPARQGFADEHVSVRWDDGRGGPWRAAADVLWRGAALPSRAAAAAWCDAVARWHPGALVVCAPYGPGPVCLAVRSGAPPLTAYVTGGAGPGVAALVGSLLHICGSARLPLDRPTRITVDSPAGGGAGWTVHLVPEGHPGPGVPAGPEEGDRGPAPGSGGEAWSGSGSASGSAPERAATSASSPAIRPASGAPTPS
jgi:hypothetical protein